MFKRIILWSLTLCMSITMLAGCGQASNKNDGNSSQGGETRTIVDQLGNTVVLPPWDLCPRGDTTVNTLSKT